MTYPHTEHEHDGSVTPATAWHYAAGTKAAGMVTGIGLDTADEAKREIAWKHGVSVEAVRVRRAGD